MRYQSVVRCISAQVLKPHRCEGVVSPVHIRFWGSDDQPEKKGAQQGVPNTVYGIKEPEIHTPKEVGPGDPIKQEEELTVEYHLPAAPPGAHRPRPIGSKEYAPMDADQYVGPAGATTGPAGKVPNAFERISKRRMSASAAILTSRVQHRAPARTLASHVEWQHSRSLSERIEVNPGGGRVAVLDMQDDTQEVADEAVAEFADGKEYTTVSVFAAETTVETTVSEPQGRQQPLEVSRFDEEPPSGGTKLGSGAGSFASGMQKRAGQAQADSMGTGGFLNPPPGEVFDETHATPQVPEQGPPGTIKGANLDSADGVTSGATQTTSGLEQAEGMGTGGTLNPPPGETFTGAGISSAPSKGHASTHGEQTAPLKDMHYTVSADSSVPPGARGFFTAPAWFAATPLKTGHKTPGAGPKKDSYAEVKHLPDRPEPVDAGVVTDLQTGTNVIGGTPVKPQAQRMNHPDQLHRDTESMQPEINPLIEKMVPEETTTLAGRPH